MHDRSGSGVVGVGRTAEWSHGEGSEEGRRVTGPRKVYLDDTFSGKNITLSIIRLGTREFLPPSTPM